MRRGPSCRGRWALACLASMGLAGCGTQTVAVDVSSAVVAVEVDDCRQNLQNRATGVLVDEGAVLTAAHPFETFDGLAVVGPGGETTRAEIILVDWGRDLAVLRLSAPVGAAIGLADASPDAGTEVSIGRFPDEGPPRLVEAIVLRRAPVTLDGRDRRLALELAGEILPGDSGAGVIDAGGKLVGVVFAANREQESGWAVAAEELSSFLEELDPNAPGLAPTCP